MLLHHSQPILPIELVDIILSYCHDSNTLLYPCSLVCQSWWLICARHLHKGRKVRLLSHLQHSDPLYNHLPLYPLHSIRDVALYLHPACGERKDDPIALDRHIDLSRRWIGQLNQRINVESLAIAMDFSGSLFLHRYYISALQTCFSNVIRLDLELRMETFNSLFSFICSFKQLEVLALSCEALQDEADAEPCLDLALPTSLHTLYLNIVVFHGFCGDQFWAWLRGQTPMNNLRNLSILNCDSSTGPEERVPTYLGLSNELTTLYLSIPADDIDPLTYLGEEDDSEYEYDLSNLENLESLSIHIPDSEVTALAPLPQLPVVLKRLTTTLKSISSIHLQKLNFIIGENNLHQISAAEWDDLDSMLSSERFSPVQKEVFVPIVGHGMAGIEPALQRARRRFSGCEEQKRLTVTHLNRHGYSGLNLLEQNPL